MTHLRALAPKIRFEKGTPWSPLTQLMAVFPARSGHAMPGPYRQLMCGAGSPVIDFYPSDFRQDLNGKKFGWQAIALLPFIDAARLQAALAPLRQALDAEEAARDSHGPARIYARADSALGALLLPLAAAQTAAAGAGVEGEKTFTASAHVAFGGRAVLPAEAIGGGHADAAGLAESGSPAGLAAAHAVVCATLCPPPPAAHVSRLLPTVTPPKRTLLEGDGPILSRDAKNVARERERSNGSGNGGGYSGGGGRGGGGYGGGGQPRRAGIGHPDRPAAAAAVSVSARMVGHALGRGGKGGAPGANGAGPAAATPLYNAYGALGAL